jgi:hypothetical protein
MLRWARAFVVVALVFASRVGSAGALDPGTHLCLEPPRLPIENAPDDPRTADLQRRLVRALEAARFAVADPAAVDAIAKRVGKEHERRFDPYTGRWDPALDATVRGAIAAALESELGCSARMRAGVVPVFAFYYDGIVRWEEQVDFASSVGRYALQALAGVHEWGFIHGLALRLGVLDRNGEEIAFRSAAIELLEAFAVQKERDLLPQDRWLTDGEKLDDAIASALGDGGSALRLEGNPQRKPHPP